MEKSYYWNTKCLTLGPLIALIAGVTIGIFMGAIPGLTAAMAIALLAPITFGMQPITAIAFLIGIYKEWNFWRIYFSYSFKYTRFTREPPLLLLTVSVGKKRKSNRSSPDGTICLCSWGYNC